jgi:hypothetical protein
MVKARRLRVLRTVPFLIAVCFVSFPARAQYGGGSGTADDPYLIYTAEQMNAIGANPDDFDKHFKLKADIDLSGYTGVKFNTVGTYAGWYSPQNRAFSGVFDGQGHTISNFTRTSMKAECIGLFTYINGKTAEIRDVVLVGPDIAAGSSDSVGALAGYLEWGTITGCYVKGGSISGKENVGGLVGENDAGTITNCYSSAHVSGEEDVGGLVGENTQGTITNCYASGLVSGSWWFVGGLVGCNWGAIADCYATGRVSGEPYAAGLVGAQHGDYSTIVNCYSTGSVSDPWLGMGNGGLVAFFCGEISNSFWDVETSGQETSQGGTGKTTAKMQTASTFLDAGWDFVGEIENGPNDVWKIVEGQTCPLLSWQKYGGGTGEPNDPYLIYTAEHLNALGAEPNDYDKAHGGY